MKMADEDGRKSFYIFGRDIATIPCFRNSYLYGISSGIAGGLATFMFTSKPRLASHVGVGTFCTVTMCYWIQCRYNWSKTKFAAAQIKAAIQQHAALEGTPQEQKLKKSDLPLADA